MSVCVGIFTGVVIFSMGYYGHWVVIQRRWTTIVNEAVFQSGAMTAARLLRAVSAYRIDTVIDYRHPDEPTARLEAAVLSAASVQYVNLPCGRLPDAATIERFIRVMDEQRRRRRRVLMHCKDGQGRAVFFAAVFRMEFLGWTPTEAYYGARRLPLLLRWLVLVIPGVGLLSPRNPKTALILNYSGGRRVLRVPPETSRRAVSSMASSAT
jgi:protein tyrosine phosphatase (PTP) superfamily phosphohydrolase (DUF442 family)